MKKNESVMKTYEENIISIYKDVLKGGRFPYGFWIDNREYKSKIIFKYVFDKLPEEKLYCMEDRFFKIWRLNYPFKNIWKGSSFNIIKSIYPYLDDGKFYNLPIHYFDNGKDFAIIKEYIDKHYDNPYDAKRCEIIKDALVNKAISHNRYIRFPDIIKRIYG